MSLTQRSKGRTERLLHIPAIATLGDCSSTIGADDLILAIKSPHQSLSRRFVPWKTRGIYWSDPAFLGIYPR
jgi:hypothetical protein